MLYYSSHPIAMTNDLITLTNPYEYNQPIRRTVTVHNMTDTELDLIQYVNNINHDISHTDFTYPETKDE
jgi:hypothetical protein